MLQLIERQTTICHSPGRILRNALSGLPSDPDEGGFGALTVELTVHEAWQVKADASHLLAAAGPDCWSPCASSTADEKAPGQQHKVTIWWPGQQQQQGTSSTSGSAPATGSGTDASSPAHAGSQPSRAPLPGSASFLAAAGASSSGMIGDSRQGMVPVGAEMIRHPVRVVQMQWSPPLFSAAPPRIPSGPGVVNPASGSSTPTAARSIHASRATTGAAQSAPHGTADALSASGVAESAALAPRPPTPALMTLGTDWVIRIWVEVVMRNMLPVELAGSMPGGVESSLSQFCLTLVIEPPSQALTAGVLPGMRACWAQPQALPAGCAEEAAASSAGGWV